MGSILGVIHNPVWIIQEHVHSFIHRLLQQKENVPLDMIAVVSHTAQPTSIMKFVLQRPYLIPRWVKHPG